MQKFDERRSVRNDGTGLAVFSLSRREWLLIGGLCVLSFVIHFSWRVHGLGEQDEGRFIIHALSWSSSGSFPIDTYVNRTSPLYVLYLAFLLDHGVSAVALPEHLNVLNVVAGSLALAPMFLLFRVLAADSLAAFLAVVTYWFVPAFWWGSGYGIPHVPAFAALLGSLTLLADALGRTGAAFVLRVLASALLLALSTALKSDILACGLAFPALVWALDARSIRNLLVALSIPAGALLAALLLSHACLPVPQTVAAFAGSWSDQFPFDLRALLSAEHWQISVEAFGVVLWCASLLALLACWLWPGRDARVTERDRRLVLLAAVWALPTVLFWALIWAHAARHLTAALCPLALLIVVGAMRLLRTAPRVSAALAALLVLNYHSAPASNHPNRAGPRLFESRLALQESVSKLMAGCERFADEPAARKLLVGYWAIPYCEYAVLARARHFTRTVNVPGESWDIETWADGSSAPTLVSVRRAPPPRPRRTDFPGWFAWDAERARAVP